MELPALRKTVKYLPLVLLSAVGLLALFVGAIANPKHPTIEIIATSLGYGIIISGLVSWILNRSFEMQIQDAFAIVKGCHGAGVKRVFTDREEALQDISEAAAQARNRFDILAIAGTDFFVPSRNGILHELETMCKSRTAISARVLLLDPRSPHAVKRCIREEAQDRDAGDSKQFRYWERKLCENILDSLRHLETILEEDKSRTSKEHARQERSGFDLRVRTYNASPTLMCARLDNLLFVEQYHNGVPKDQIATLFERCLGKTVPIIETTPNSKLGQVITSHFDDLWESSEVRTFRPGCISALEDSLRNDDWISVAKQRHDEEEALLQIRKRLPPAQDTSPANDGSVAD